MTEKHKFDQQVSEDIFKQKYCLHEGDNSLEDVAHGVAQEIAMAEKKKNRDKYERLFYDEIISGRFIPGGRILANARVNSPMKNYSNCFTIEVEDDMEKIFESLKEDAMISKVGGGVGFNISKLRPEGSDLSIGGIASGPISFLEIFNQSAKTIMTGGWRRAAHIAIMNVDHPDIEKFITYKQGDKSNRLTQFNISVGITEAFMSAVTLDEPWDLVYDDKVYKTVSARGLFDLITRNAYEHNEPGVFFLDEANRYNNGYWAFNMDRTNPSLQYDTRVLTTQGIFPINELENKEFTVSNLNGKLSPAKCFLSGKHQQLWEVKLEDGTTFYCTKEHKWPVWDGMNFAKKYTSDILTGDKIASVMPSKLPIVNNSFTREDGFMLGWLYGDGWITQRSDNKHFQYGFIFNKDEKSIGEKVLQTINVYNNDQNNLIKHKTDGTYSIQVGAQSFHDIMRDKFGVDKKENGLPVSVWIGGNDFASGFLDGIFAADGHFEYATNITGNKRAWIEITNKHPRIIADLKELLGFYGIRSKIRNIKNVNPIFPNGKQYNKTYYAQKVIINEWYSKFFIEIVQPTHPLKKVTAEKIFNHEYNGKRNKNSRHIIRVSSVKPTDAYEDVYDICVDDTTHCFALSTAITGNCGEVTMGPYSLCDLGAINLSQFINNPFTTCPTFDWLAYYKTISTGIRFLDNVLNRTNYPLEKIKQVSMKWRRIGLGITGLGDAFAMMGYKYGDPESIKFSMQLAETLKVQSYLASSNLAKEKGKFPGWDNRIFNSPFMCNLPDTTLEVIKKQGLRNIGMNTIAPTGTTALSIGNNCSSGIEPIFALEYTRNIRTEKDDTRTEIVQDYAWKLYNDTKEKDYDNLKVERDFVTTKDICGEDAIAVQAVWQRHIDHSISKTHNLAPGTTLEEYQELFKLAWIRGLKGFTSFNPEGSMKGILEYSDTEKDNRVVPKRPKKVLCDIYYTTVKKERFLILVGVDENEKPYEIFVTTMQGRKFDLDKNKKGVIDKVRKGCYNLIINDEIVIEDISKEFDPTLGTLSRFISMSIRHNVPLQFIVEQLHKGSGFTSFAKIVGRILKKYIPQQEKVMSSDKCPNCGSDLMYVEGCKKCSSLCGWEACS